MPLAIPAARIIHCRILTWTELGICLEIEYDFDHATRHDRLVHGYMRPRQQRHRGGGIFTTTGLMARELGDPLLILLLWFIGALFAIGAAMSANMVLLGDKLGLYKSMAKMGMVTLVELAKATKTTKRDVREWLGNQAAGGYVTYDTSTGRYTIPEEQAVAASHRLSAS